MDRANSHGGGDDDKEAKNLTGCDLLLAKYIPTFR